MSSYLLAGTVRKEMFNGTPSSTCVQWQRSQVTKSPHLGIAAQHARSGMTVHGEGVLSIQHIAPQLVIEPREALIDAPLRVTATGFTAGAPVVIRSSVEIADGQRWETHAEFVADEAGVVDLSTSTPVSGDWHGADANALIWSLRPTGDGPQRRGLGAGLDPYTLTVTAESGDTSAETTVTRLAIAPDVHVEEIRDNGLYVNLFLPPGDGPFPTVLVVGGSGGGFADQHAALYASHGIAAVSLAYFNVAGLPDELLQIPLEYFEHALDWIAAREDLDRDHLAISGTSRGGELALLLASRYPVIRSVVAWVPSGYLWGAVSINEDLANETDYASWTYHDEPLPFAGRVRNTDVEPNADGVLELTPAFHQHLEDPQVAEAAEIPVENINGPVILVSGQADALWPSAFFGDRIVERLTSRGFDFPVEHLSYEQAGHGIGAGIAPTTITQGFHPIRKQTIAYGGTPEGLARARSESWARVLDFVTHTTRRQET